MSIWATIFSLGDDSEHDAPIVYYGSHRFPTDIRDGTVDVALIPGFINPESINGAGDYADEHDPAPHPFLRLCVNHSEVILDRGQVLGMFHRLGEWLMATAADEVERAATALPEIR